MTGSLRTHGGLIPGREGKGRERNREGKNTPRRQSKTNLTQVTREHAKHADAPRNDRPATIGLGGDPR